MEVIMDWHTIAVGAVSFLAGMATTVMLAALAVASQHEQRMEAGETKTKTDRRQYQIPGDNST